MPSALTAASPQPAATHRSDPKPSEAGTPGPQACIGHTTSGFKIGEVARRSGLPVKTIRFYSDEGLIQPIGRSSGRYRLFDESVYADLRLIRTLKALEIPLVTVRQLIEVRRSGICSCASLKALITAKSQEIRQRIESLESLELELEKMRRTWIDCGGAQAPG